jgi:hypothetical protein
MKFLLICLLMSISLSSEINKTYILGISPNMEKNQKEFVWEELTNFLLEVELGSNIFIYNAFKNEEIMNVKIPNEEKYRIKSKSRTKYLKKRIKKLHEFFKKSNYDESMMSSIISFPTFIKQVGSNHQNDDNKIIIVIGNAFYYNSKEGYIDIKDYYPSDGFLTLESSVFNTIEQLTLKNAEVYYYHFNNEEFINYMHKDKIKRFYSLFIQLLDGCLVKFDHDIHLDKIISENRSSCIESYNLKNEKPENILPVLMEKTINQGEVGIWDNEGIAYERPNSTIDKFEIGITWNCDCDIDLYVTPFPSSQELYYANHKTNEAIYEKDYLTSPSDKKYETVKVNKKIDIKNTSIWINNYKCNNSMGDIIGEVRLKFKNGGKYVKDFKLINSNGNKGANRFNRENDRHWVNIDINSLIGL